MNFNAPLSWMTLLCTRRLTPDIRFNVVFFFICDVLTCLISNCAQGDYTCSRSARDWRNK